MCLSLVKTLTRDLGRLVAVLVIPITLSNWTFFLLSSTSIVLVSIARFIQMTTNWNSFLRVFGVLFFVPGSPFINSDFTLSVSGKTK